MMCSDARGIFPQGPAGVKAEEKLLLFHRLFPAFVASLRQREKTPWLVLCTAGCAARTLTSCRRSGLCCFARTLTSAWAWRPHRYTTREMGVGLQFVASAKKGGKQQRSPRRCRGLLQRTCQRFPVGGQFFWPLALYFWLHCSQGRGAKNIHFVHRSPPPSRNLFFSRDAGSPPNTKVSCRAVHSSTRAQA